MPMSRIKQAIERARSHINYYRYRKSIGKPIPLSESCRDAVARFFFELRNIR